MFPRFKLGQQVFGKHPPALPQTHLFVKAINFHNHTYDLSVQDDRYMDDALAVNISENTLEDTSLEERAVEQSGGIGDGEIG